MVCKVQSNAFIYAFGVLLAYLVAVVYLENREKLRLGLIYSGSIIAALFLGELYFSFQNESIIREDEMVYGNKPTGREPILGVAPSKNSQIISRLTKSDTLLYEVTITIDEYGRRTGPRADSLISNAVMFFGCSFTFSDGLEDHETLPYQFQELSNNKYEAYNFGYSGYGAHQTLAILENDLDESGIPPHDNTIGVYTLISDHVLRGTYSGFNFSGPKYLLNQQGEAEYSGMFPIANNRWMRFLGKSHLYGRLYSAYEKPRQKDIDLVLSMIDKSSKTFTAKYNGQFYVTLWRLAQEENEGIYERLLKGLKTRGIEVLEIEEIIPDYSQRPLEYATGDKVHPNSYSNFLISTHLLKLLTTIDSTQD